MIYDYSNAFQKALGFYQKQTERPGYPKTFFSWFRHSAKKYPLLVEFENALNQASNQNKKQIIENFLNDSRLKNNNHSFRSYLLDVLIKDFPSENWQRFDNKKIVFYNAKEKPYLYRGTLQPPESAYKLGISSSYSKNIEDYIELPNFSNGVSTSYSPSIANLFSTMYKTDHNGIHEFPGFLYQIQYRGNQGIDINATHRARGEQLPSFTQQEVNIAGSIPAKDIVGMGYVENDQYYPISSNPNFEPEREAEPPLEKPAFLAKVFGF